MCLTHRYYDPGTGKFINRDPIGYAGGANLYGFCAGNPVNESDPSGFSEDPHAPPGWIGLSVASYIPQKTVIFPSPLVYPAIWGGNDRHASSNSNSYKIEVNYWINQKTGQVKSFPQKPGHTEMTLVGGKKQYAQASLLYSTRPSGFMGFGYFYDSARAGNPFFMQAPPVNLSSTFFYGDKGVWLQLSYGDFPATEVWEYRAGKAPKKLFNYEPSAGDTPANLADPPQNKFIHL